MARPLFFAPLASLALVVPTAAHAQSFDVTGGYQRRADDAPPTSPTASYTAPSSSSATSPPQRPFGAPGEFVLSTSATTAYVSSSQFDGSDASYLNAGFSPGFDYFVARHVSLGLDLEVYYSRSDGYGADGSLVRTTQRSFAGGPRLGVDLPLGEKVSFYPRLTFGVESLHQEQALLAGPTISTATSATGSPAQTNTGAWLNVFTPLLLHPRSHFFLGAGPRVFHGFAKTVTTSGAGGERTTIGAALIVGGSFGGERADGEEAREPDAAPPPPVRRFGEAGEVVLTGEMSASVESLSYRGSDAQYLSASFAPGFDVFAVDHVSLGLDFGVGYASTTGYGSDGSRIDFTQTSVGLAPRVGVDVPFTSWLSLYPRAEIGFGSLTQDETSTSGAENRHSVTRTWVSINAPLLVHPAPHFFAGFGPLVMHELAASDQLNKDNRRTTLGATLLLGGWL